MQIKHVTWCQPQSTADVIPPEELKNLNEIKDVDKAREKINQLLAMYAEDSEADDANRTRRQAWMNPYALGLPAMYTAEEYRMKRQIIDNMVQLLYMARYKIRSMEKMAGFDTKDLGYRVAFAYRMSNRIYVKLKTIYKMHLQNKYTFGNSFDHLILHHKAARLHLDFLYLHWVMIKIDEFATRDARQKAFDLANKYNKFLN